MLCARAAMTTSRPAEPLSMQGTGQVIEINSWLDWAYAQPAEQGSLRYGNVRLDIRSWGQIGDPGVVLVHGGSANNHWWDHVAPWLAIGRRVVALDLSGHGESDWRSGSYTLGKWAKEVQAVAATIDTPQTRPVIIGHSLGGLVVLKGIIQDRGLLGGAIALDVRARAFAPEEQAHRNKRASRDRRVFDTKAAAISAFRTLPDAGERQIGSIVRHIANYSVRQIEDGWTWKADPRIFQRDAVTPEDLSTATFPVALVAAERGLLRPSSIAAMLNPLGDRALAMSIPGAGHHLMLDRPVALTACLRHILDRWSVG
jgi:pimeloyl-ACP methyl ester carboxylesterase